MIFGCCQNNDVQNGAICFLMNIGGLKKSSIMENATSSDRRSGLQTWLVWGEGGGGRMQDQDLWALFNLLIMLTTTNSPALMNKQSLEFQTTSDCRSRSIRLIVIFYVYILPGLRRMSVMLITFVLITWSLPPKGKSCGTSVASWWQAGPAGGQFREATEVESHTLSLVSHTEWYLIQWYRIQCSGIVYYGCNSDYCGLNQALLYSVPSPKWPSV